MLFDKLRQIEERSEELSRALADPALYGQTAEYAACARSTPSTVEIVGSLSRVPGRCSSG